MLCLLVGAFGCDFGFTFSCLALMVGLVLVVGFGVAL